MPMYNPYMAPDAMYREQLVNNELPEPRKVKEEAHPKPTEPAKGEATKIPPGEPQNGAKKPLTQEEPKSSKVEVEESSAIKEEQGEDKKAGSATIDSIICGLTGCIEKLSKVYSVQYLLQFRPKCQRKPKDMRVIEMPLKSNINIKFEPYEEIQRSETAESVRNLRILLNKLSKDNFARISDSILNNFAYNTEIMGELAHILFNKCVKEHNYIDVYMKLVDQLLRKFKVPKGKEADKTGQVLNFKKMFIDNCQSTFEEKSTEEFMKALPSDLDEEEKKQKKRQRMFGNTKLIGQLFIRGVIPEIVVKNCLDRLFKDIKEDNVENVCHLLTTIGRKMYEKFAFDAQQTTSTKKPKIRLKNLNKESFDDYVDRLITLKQADGITSRVKFMIQDVIDAKNEDWNNAFDKFPVPPRSGKGHENIAAYYKKTKSIDKPEVPAPGPEVKAPEAIPDPKLEQHELRKKSMNEQNVLGRNIEKFQKTQIEERVRV